MAQNIGQASTTTSLGSSPNPSTFGQAVTLTATVTAAGGTPTGTVTFKDGGATIGTGALSGDAATFTTSSLTSGAHSFTAVYAGDNNFTTSTSTALAQTVGQAPTTTSLSSSANPSTFGQSVIFTVTVTSSGGTPTGTVTFIDGGRSFGTGTVSGGTATLATSTLTPGAHSITAVYGGGGDFAGSTSDVLTETVNRAETKTSLSSTPNPSVVGQSVTFTATVAAGSGSPGGSVSFLDGGTTLGTVALASATATFTTSSLSIASHSIAAVYAGDTNFAGSSSSALTQNVIGNGQIILAVSSDGDDAFSFSSSTPALNASVRTSNGSGQTPALALPPGSYSVDLQLPSGFGLASVRCSDSGSVGNTAAHSAKIVLAPLETVTCVFAALGSRKKTVEAIGEFMNRRNDLLLSNGPDGRRQIDRLLAAGSQNASSQGSAEQSPSFAPPSHLSGSGSSGFIGAPVAGIGGRADRSIATQIASPPSSATEATPGPSPFVANASSEGSTTVSFATSLSQMLSYQSAANQKKIDNGLPRASHLGGITTPTQQSLPFDIWVEGHYGDFGDRTDRQSESGHFGIMYVGADYVLTPWLLVGALVQYDATDLTSRQDSYSVSGHGWMAGPYATMRLSENVFLQGRAAWGTSDNTVSPYLTYKDNFSTSRWLVSGTLAGRWQWEIGNSIRAHRSPISTIGRSTSPIPLASIFLGSMPPSVSLRRARKSPTPSSWPKGRSLCPRASVEAIWNFAGSDPTSDFGGTLAGPTGVRARAEVGLGIKYLNGAGLDLSVSYDGIGAGGYNSTAGEGSLKLPFD